MPYVVRKEIVAQCLARLREQKTHTSFAGYLCLQRRAARLRRLEDLQPDFLPFFKQFFLVEDHPLGAPYIKPFTEQKPSDKNLWLNENVAGSYAPSSVRIEQPFRRVVTIQEKTYSLPPDHARLALEHLLYSVPVKVMDLAVFLYRDYGLLGDSVHDLIDVFAYEFGYAADPGGETNADFKILFRLPRLEDWDRSWLEPVNPSARPAEKEARVSPKRTHKVRGLTAEDLLPSKAAPDLSAPFRELAVEGLLSFGERTEFALGRLNLLVGPNGSGKSNLIDCVRLLQNAPYDIQDAFSASGFEEWLYKGSNQRQRTAYLQVTARVPEIPGTLSHQIRLGPPVNSRAPLEEVISNAETDDEGPEQHFVGSRRGGATLSVAGSGKRRRSRRLREDEYDPFRSILSQIRDLSQYPEITRLSDLYGRIRIYSEWTFGRKSILREAPPAGRSDTTLSESMDNLPVALNSLEKTAAHKRILELLQELKETYRDYVTRLVFGRIGLELQEDLLSSNVSAQHLSDGTLRFLALAALLLNADPPALICLEEPELGMHPDMIRMVAGMLVDASARTQLIITTHSEHLLTALQDDFDVLFAFDAGVAGSVVRRFSQEEYKLWREEHTLGELWTSGELGGNRW